MVREVAEGQIEKPAVFFGHSGQPLLDFRSLRTHLVIGDETDHLSLGGGFWGGFFAGGFLGEGLLWDGFLCGVELRRRTN